MKRIVLLQFHRDVALVRNRVRLLAAFDRDIEIYGMYGGRERLFPVFRAGLRGLDRYGFRGVYCVRGQTTLWKRTNPDLSMLRWFADVGHALDFDQVLLLQYDLLLFDSLDRLYEGVPPDAVGLTGLARLADVQDGWPWTTYAAWSREWDDLLADVRAEHGYAEEPYTCLGPGMALPRSFVERYEAIRPRETCHDEVRVPLYAQILGVPMADTGFYRAWFDPEEERVFNADEAEIDVGLIGEQLRSPGGRRAFHPFRAVYGIAELARPEYAHLGATFGSGRRADLAERIVSRLIEALRIPHRTWRSVGARLRRRTGNPGWPN